MIAVTIATTAVWVAGVCTLMTLRRPGIAAPVSVVPAPAVPVQAVPVQAVPVQAVPVQAVPVQAVPVQAVAHEAVLPAPRVSPEDEAVMPPLPAPPFIPSPRPPSR